MNRRENYLRAARFEGPERVPMIFHVNPSCWNHFQPAPLAELMAAHPRLFPDFDPNRPGGDATIRPWQRANQPYTDPWQCVWNTSEDGLTGTVVRHPLADWDAWPAFRPPDPAGYDGMQGIDWTKVAAQFANDARQERIREGGLRHGHTFQRMSYLRGYENLILDMADAEPRLESLIQMVEAFNAAIVRRYLELGADVITFPEDLGMQRGPMVSPELFRRYVKPSYGRLMEPAGAAGAVVHMHSDGDIRSLADDLLDCGVDVLNLQDLANGLEWIGEHLKGRVCIDLDLDRQSVTRFGTPAEIDCLVREAVRTLGSPRGGLMMIYGLYPGVPLDNVAAVMDAMDRYAGHFS